MPLSEGEGCGQRVIFADPGFYRRIEDRFLSSARAQIYAT